MDPISQGINAMYVQQVMQLIAMGIDRNQERQMLERTHIEKPMEYLRYITREGSVILIEGLPGTGKTSLALLIAEANKDRSVYASNNPGIEGTYIDNFADFDVWLEKHKDTLKIFIWDDLADIFTARRSMRNEHMLVRTHLLESRKKGVCLVVIQHFEKGADIDFRRFANWVLYKPWEDVPGDMSLEVPMEERKKVIAYRNDSLKWWTDKLPPTKIKFNTIDRGVWVFEKKGKKEEKVIQYAVEDLTFEIEEKHEDPDFLERVITKIDVDEQSLEWYRKYIDGVSFRAMAGKTRETARQRVKAITEAKSGYAAEDAYAERFPSYKHEGKNTPFPDFVDHKNKVVYSFKWRDFELERIDRIAESEKAYLKKGYDLKIVCYVAKERMFYTLHLVATDKQ
jgi:hypothetical protein